MKRGRRHCSTQGCLGKWIILIKLYFFKHSHRGRTSCLTYTDLWIFLKYKTKFTKKFFSTFCICNPISTGTLAAGGSEGQLELPLGSHRAQEESTSLGVASLTHAGILTYWSATPHTQHRCRCLPRVNHSPAEVCSTLGKPNM